MSAGAHGSILSSEAETEAQVKILLAYDGRPHTAPALDEVALWAGDKDATITVLSVVPPGEAPSRFATGPRPHAHADVEHAQRFLQERGIDPQVKITQGDPADEIIDEATEGDYQLIVVGTHGRGRLGRLVLGSVSSEVAERAPCAVVIAGEEHRMRLEPRHPADRVT
jgi:nucleotide-binding universal stress UspA family protein